MIARVNAPESRCRRLMLVLVLLAVTVVGFAAPGSRKIESLNFFNAEIPVVLKSLADLGGVNIVVGPSVKGIITVKLKNITVDEALQIITQLSGLAYGQSNGAYIVNTPEAIAALTVPNSSHLVVTLTALSPADAISALGTAYRDLQVKELPDSRIVLAGPVPRLEKAKAFLSEIDVPSAQLPNVLPPLPGAKETGYLVVTLKALGQADAVGILTPAFKDIIVTLLPDKRKVMLAGEGRRLEQARDFLTEIDVPTAQQIQTAEVEKTYRLKYAVPWQAKQYLEDLYRDRALVVTYAPTSRALAPLDTRQPEAPAATDTKTTTPATGKSTASAWESRDLTLRGGAAVVEQALASLAKVDIDAPVVEKRCLVKRIFGSQAIIYLLDRYESRGLQIITAPMTAAMLTTTGAAGAKTGQVGAIVRRDETGKLNVTEPIGDFILRGPVDVVDEALAAVPGIDVGPERVERVVSLRFLQAAGVKEQFESLYGKDGLQIILAPSRRGDSPEELKSLKAEGSDDGNTDESKATPSLVEVYDLILRGPEPVVTRAEATIHTLDTEPQQISIKAEIISINSAELQNLGVQWAGTSPGSLKVDINEVQSGDPLRIGQIIRTPFALSATINALQTRNKAKVINRPASVVKNGREAAIHVGDVIFYETLAGYDQNGRQIWAVKQLDTGVRLQVRPLVSPDGVITLEIASNVTEPPSFRKGASGADLPVIRESSSTTVVQVRNNETLVIGGLMQSTQQETQQRVPGLSRIPLLGHLFTNKETKPSQTELIILVTPTLLTPGGAPAAPATGTAPTAAPAPAPATK